MSSRDYSTLHLDTNSSYISHVSDEIFLNFFQSQTRIVHGHVVCDICQIKIKCGIFVMSTSQTPLVLSYISFGLVKHL